ncbi:MAG: M20/M25/M40 family metallo-hydrolase [Candidatus Krumholzibacteriia bacterium]
MSRIRTVLPCLLLLLILAVPAAAAPELVYLRVEPEQGPAFTAADLDLVAEVPGGFLALLDDGDLARLRAWGLPHEVLATDDPTTTVLVQYDAPGGHEPTRLPADHAVLFRGEAFTVVRVPTAALDGLMCLHDIQRVFRRPLRFVDRPWRGPVATSREADPAVAEMVDTVDEAWLQTQVLTLEDFGTRHSSRPEGAQAAAWLRDQFLAYGYLDVTFQDFDGNNDNVVCIKPGAVQPDRYVVIGGHFDSTSGNTAVAPGADDNATGTVGVLAAARAMAGHEFEYSVVFLCFSGEEQGLLGSQAWASQAADQGLDIVGAIIMDMLAYRAAGDAADIDIVSNGTSQPLRDLVDAAAADYVPGQVVVTGSLPFGASSDHASFWNNGYRAVLFFEDSGSYSPYIHTSSDVVGLSANDFAFMNRNVRTAVASVATLARPFRVAIAHTPLPHTSDLGPFLVEATILAAGELDPASLQLHYRTGGAFTTVALAPTGIPGGYAASIAAQAPGVEVAYYLSAGDTEGHLATSPDLAPDHLHGFRTGVAPVLVDDVETDLGWTLGQPGDTATTGQWIWADPVGTTYQPEDDHTPAPGVLCFVTGNSFPGDAPGAADVDGGFTTLVSPVFDLAGADWALVSYWRYYVLETTLDDVFTVDISSDGGGTWSSLETVTATEGWTEVGHELDPSLVPFTDQMRLRFRASDTGGGSLVEALVDDVFIASTTGDLTAAEPPAADLSLGAFPNPFNPATTLRYALPRAGWAEIRVFDAAGRLVARPLAGRRPAGPGTVAWQADQLASGVYLVVLGLDGQDLRSTKLTLVR